jgi:hypothetical protein
MPLHGLAVTGHFRGKELRRELFSRRIHVLSGLQRAAGRLLGARCTLRSGWKTGTTPKSFTQPETRTYMHLRFFCCAWSLSGRRRGGAGGRSPKSSRLTDTHSTPNTQHMRYTGYLEALRASLPCIRPCGSPPVFSELPQCPFGCCPTYWV